MRLFDLQFRHKLIEKIDVSRNAVFQKRLVGFSETDLIGHENVVIRRQLLNVKEPVFCAAAESMQEEAEAWNRVQRQLVVLNWILTAATGVGAAAVVFLAVH